tara:strand:- start:8012 stop:8683 length:672 start_codon:yes stop_codon:yes gene_type:complete
MRTGELPLIAVYHRDTSFLDAAFEARRALSCATTDSTVNHAAARMMVQLHGLNECLANMAETGLLNIDVTATGLTTHTRFVDGNWTSQTRVTRLPSRVCQEVKLPPEICNVVMQTMVVLSAVAGDANGELVEVRELAAVLVNDWPSLQSTAVGKGLEGNLRVAWQSHAPSSPSDNTQRFARALTEKLRSLAVAAGGDDPGDADTALEYARRTLAVISRPIAER